MSASAYDLVVVGGGPGGYVAAIRASQLGLRTVCVERERLGGICLNWGCIPTKALLRSAEVLELCQRAEEFGVKIEGRVTFDFAQVMDRARKVVDAQEKGIQFLFKKYKVDHLPGVARLAGAGRVAVRQGNGGEQTVSGKHVLLATGARARSLPGIEIDERKILSYRGILALRTLPRSLIVIGAGAIGVEFASFFRSLGVEVSLVEFLPRVVPVEDEEISDTLARSFHKRGIRLHLGQKVTGARAAADGAVVVSLEDRADAGKRQELRAELALMAVGIAANVEGLGLEEAGVRIDRGFVTIDETSYRTTAANVYAIGDMTGPPALAHVASSEAVACVERLAGHTPTPIDYDTIPAGTFCHPEIGSVGLSEARAKELGRAIKVGRFPFRALGKARAAGEVEGFVKVIYDAADGRLLGAHIIGPNASDLIAEFALAKSTEVNAPSLMHTVHAHPTLAEALKEASEDAYGVSVHI